MRPARRLANSGEHRPLACSFRQLAGNIFPRFTVFDSRCAFGRRPNAAGWQPALPSKKAPSLR